MFLVRSDWTLHYCDNLIATKRRRRDGYTDKFKPLGACFTKFFLHRRRSFCCQQTILIQRYINLGFVSFKYYNGFVASKSGFENGLSFVGISGITSFLQFFAWLTSLLLP